MQLAPCHGERIQRALWGDVSCGAVRSEHKVFVPQELLGRHVQYVVPGRDAWLLLLLVALHASNGGCGRGTASDPWAVHRQWTQDKQVDASQVGLQLLLLLIVH